ncbi:ABC transporter substrate-binding protein [Paenibacillus roseipurpureus]|uniref:Sugar ABC transporter substrate-binding protein n=1 Tax=Paenibacillus roseopurpureus TaxID=2918901 RepID=A0AA96LLZ7_9BACL|nr:sugar ABC transporter substrate-binding protein [Paenibacillus sp. MBLB1832]WNR43046.1 sugar ABC transporter substrate-binding protein [Paenibacillus sp. MBLB1832]
MKKTVISALASVLALGTVLTGCGEKDVKSTPTTVEAGKANPVTIRFLYWAKPEVYKPAIEAFEKKYPNIKVKYETVVENDSNESMKKMDVLYASGDTFDVFSLNAVPAFAQRATNGMLEPLDEYLKKEGVKYEDIYKAEQIKVGGQRYSLPGKFGPWFVLLNKAQLDAAGLPVPSSWTWDEFREYAKKLTKGEGPSKQYGTFFHTWKDYMLLKKYSTPVNQNILTDDGSAFDRDNPLLKASMELRYNMEQVDKSAPPYIDVVSQKIPYRDQYFQGKAAMLPTGPWMITEAGGTDKIPATFVSAFAPWPTNNKGDEPYSFGGADPLVISSKSQHKQEAYQFIRFLTTEGMTLTGQLSAWKNADVAKELEQIINTTKSPDKIDKDSLIHVHKVTKLPNPVVPPAYSGEVEKAFLSQAEKYLLGETKLDATVDAMKTNISKIIESNKK